MSRMNSIWNTDCAEIVCKGKTKSPFRFDRKGLVIQVRLEHVDCLCREQEGILLVASGRGGVTIAAAIGMIPTEFQAGQHIRPERVLNGGCEFLSLIVRIRRDNPISTHRQANRIYYSIGTAIIKWSAFKILTT